MKSRKSLVLGSLVFLFILFFLSLGILFQARSGQAQVTSGYDGQTVQALLNEVRQLRLAIQQSNQNTPRTQIVLERLRIHQENVNSLTRELANVRDQIAESKNNQAQMLEFLKVLEAQINKEADVTRRAEMESQFKALRNELGSVDISG